MGKKIRNQRLRRMLQLIKHDQIQQRKIQRLNNLHLKKYLDTPNDSLETVDE